VSSQSLTPRIRRDAATTCGLTHIRGVNALVSKVMVFDKLRDRAGLSGEGSRRRPLCALRGGALVLECAGYQRKTYFSLRKLSSSSLRGVKKHADSQCDGCNDGLSRRKERDWPCKEPRERTGRDFAVSFEGRSLLPAYSSPVMDVNPPRGLRGRLPLDGPKAAVTQDRFLSCSRASVAIE
jgi:hypothetical protein